MWKEWKTQSSFCLPTHWIFDMGKQKTIKDVAELAGVSVATASRVLSDSDYPVRPQLQQKVREAAEKLEYAPNAMAQSLRREVCRDVALIVPNISNPFYLQAVLGVGEALSSGDYNMIFCNTMHDPDRERNFLRQLYERQVRGVILSSVAEGTAELVQKFIQRGMKFVLLDQMLPGVESPAIHYDSRAGAKMAVEHLVEMGHKRIAFATTSLVRFTRTEIYKGYRDALVAAGLPAGGELVYECAINKAGRGSDYELNIGRQIAADFIKDGCPATAILCINDMVAVGLIQSLVRNGIRVPEDVSVIGFDDIPIAAAFLPPLTTVHYPAQEIGRLAALMLMDSIQNNEDQTALSMSLTPKLMLRDSVCPPKDR